MSLLSLHVAAVSLHFSRPCSFVALRRAAGSDSTLSNAGTSHEHSCMACITFVPCSAVIINSLWSANFVLFASANGSRCVCLLLCPGACEDTQVRCCFTTATLEGGLKPCSVLHQAVCAVRVLACKNCAGLVACTRCCRFMFLAQRLGLCVHRPHERCVMLCSAAAANGVRMG
jgi:hypothetical protein